VGRLRYEAGQTVVLFALLVPLFLGLGAIAVDVGYWYVVKKSAQDAADAAALAAARDLDQGKAVAEQTAIEYVHANMPDAPDPYVEFPYVADDPLLGVIGDGQPDYTKVEVVVTHATETFFGRLFGLVEPTVHGRAVAERVNAGRLAIYAHEYRCVEDALTFRGDDHRIRGRVHSDGTYTVDGHGSYTAQASYYEAGCTPSIDPGNSFGGNPSPTPIDARMVWTEFFTISDFADYACTNPLVGELHFDQDGGTIPDGVYCADTFTVDGDDISGNITVIARQITINGTGHRFRPYTEDLLFFVPPNRTVPTVDDGPPEECSTEMGDIEVRGSDIRLEGIIFNPCKLVTIAQESDTGSAAPMTMKGQILAMRVTIEGDKFLMTGTGEGSSIVLALVE
jgi:hypothetical protein